MIKELAQLLLHTDSVAKRTNLEPQQQIRLWSHGQPPTRR
jgi:hypothetical protein